METNFDEFFILMTGNLAEGWVEYEQEAPFYESAGIPNVLKDLVKDARYDQVTYRAYVNKVSSEREDNPNQKLFPSGAVFANGINVQAGIIIADYSLSPRVSTGLGELFTPDPFYSRIAQWSQAAMGMFEWETALLDDSSDATRIGYVIQSIVTNLITCGQIFEALKGIGMSEVPRFADRKEFRRDSSGAELDGFYAMLGTPNGSGSGFLLATHKRKIGIKRVRSITVWNHPAAAPAGPYFAELKINMLFTFEVVANPTDGSG